MKKIIILLALICMLPVCFGYTEPQFKAADLASLNPDPQWVGTTIDKDDGLVHFTFSMKYIEKEIIDGSNIYNFDRHNITYTITMQEVRQCGQDNGVVACKNKYINSVKQRYQYLKSKFYNYWTSIQDDLNSATNTFDLSMSSEDFD